MTAHNIMARSARQSGHGMQCVPRLPCGLTSGVFTPAMNPRTCHEQNGVEQSSDDTAHSREGLSIPLPGAR